MKAIKFLKSITIISLGVAAVLTMSSFDKKGGGDAIASNTKVVNGNTAGVSAKKDFNAGEEIFLYIPLKNTIGDKPFIRLESDGNSIFTHDLLAYKSEEKLNYYAFSLAVDPKNHIPDFYFYKDGNNYATLRELSKLSPGKHKITFGITSCFTCPYFDKITININVTEEGAKKWADWSTELK